MTNTPKEDDILNKGEWVSSLRIGKDIYNRLVIKAKDTMNKIKKMKGKRVSENDATEFNRLLKDLREIDLQLELQLRIQERQKEEELQHGKVEKLRRRKLKKEKDTNVTPEPQDQQLVKLAKKQQRKNWRKAKKNHNVIEYMHYVELTTDQSNEIHSLTLWCYYDSHGNTTRMSNDPLLTKNMKTTTPVTIAPEKKKA